jgi:methionine-rich copper-binding protein CopC
MRKLILAAAMLAALSARADAHAFLERASPAVGSTVPAAPPELALTFTEAVEPRFSTVAVLDPRGGRIDTGQPRAAGNGRQLIVGLPKLGPGTYTVNWHVTSVDTHKTEGKFQFTVAP